MSKLVTITVIEQKEKTKISLTFNSLKMLRARFKRMKLLPILKRLTKLSYKQ